MNQDSKASFPPNPKDIKKISIIQDPNSDYNLKLDTIPLDYNQKETSPDIGTTEIIINAADKIKEKLDKSDIDELTGCYNRNYYEKFKKENFDNNRDDEKLGLVFVDINNLKTVNDNLGHKAGDKRIQEVAIFLKSNFRKDDIVVRLGGDEFVVICHNQENDPNFRENLPLKITDRLEQKLKLEDNNTEVFPLSFAFGVAVYNKELDTPSEDEKSKGITPLDKAKIRADDLMYQHKKASKNGH